jgi:hypothetical protein
MEASRENSEKVIGLISFKENSTLVCGVNLRVEHSGIFICYFFQYLYIFIVTDFVRNPSRMLKISRRFAKQCSRRLQVIFFGS